MKIVIILVSILMITLVAAFILPKYKWPLKLMEKLSSYIYKFIGFK